MAAQVFGETRAPISTKLPRRFLRNTGETRAAISTKWPRRFCAKHRSRITSRSSTSNSSKNSKNSRSSSRRAGAGGATAARTAGAAAGGFQQNKGGHFDEMAAGVFCETREQEQEEQEE